MFECAQVQMRFESYSGEFPVNRELHFNLFLPQTYHMALEDL